MAARIALALLALGSAARLLAQESAPYPVFETDLLPPAEFQARRQKLKAEIGSGNLALFFTNPVQNRNNDVDFPFRGDSNFLYLTGFDEPDAALLLVPGGFTLGGKRVTEVLFTNVTTPMSLTWLGYRMGPENAKRLLGIEAALPNTEFEKTLTLAAGEASGRKVSAGFVPPDANHTLANMVQAYQKWRAASGFADGVNARRAVLRMREIKSPAEIALLKKAAEISALAHIEAMRSMEPGMREYEIAWLVQYIFGKYGCEWPGYPPICGAGVNSTILHYQSNRKQMQAGEIFCMDTAGEYRGYSADITRSFPVSGKFSPEQRAIYNLVLKAEQAGIAMCRAGTAVSSISQRISQILGEGLIELGIIQNQSELRRYYMHGFGHGIGLDVHDPMPSTLAP
jgi:Xaa-Pro aminopeptidase